MLGEAKLSPDLEQAVIQYRAGEKVLEVGRQLLTSDISNKVMGEGVKKRVSQTVVEVSQKMSALVKENEMRVGGVDGLRVPGTAHEYYPGEFDLRYDIPQGLKEGDDVRVKHAELLILRGSDPIRIPAEVSPIIWW